jgi:TolA-binding protein
MKNLLRFAFFAVLTLSLTACGSNKEEALTKIKELEGKLLDSNGNPKDEASAYNLQVAYDDFSERFSEDPQASEYLFKAATISINLNWGESAVKILDKFMLKYPESPQAPEALFFLGYVHDDLINNDVKAGEYYNQFLKKYPGHTLAKDAEASIRNLGKTDEELMREFEKMNSDSLKKDTASASV